MSQKPQRDLVLLVGMQASGKSTYLAENSDQYKEYAIISMDEAAKTILNKMNEEEGVNANLESVFNSNNTEYKDVFNKKLQSAVDKGQNIILDTANGDKEKRAIRTKSARNSNKYNYKITAVIVHDLEEQEHQKRLWERAIKEGRFYSINESSLTNIEAPDLSEVDEIIHIGKPPEKSLYSEYKKGDKSLKEIIEQVSQENKGDYRGR